MPLPNMRRLPLIPLTLAGDQSKTVRTGARDGGCSGQRRGGKSVNLFCPTQRVPAHDGMEQETAVRKIARGVATLLKRAEHLCQPCKVSQLFCH